MTDDGRVTAPAGAQGTSLVPPPGWLTPREESRPGPGGTFLLIMTLLAAAVRLYGLRDQSLWVDEMLTWQAVRPGVGLAFLEQVRDTIQGPLYMAVIWPLVRLADPELMMRLTSAAAGVATVPLFGAWAGRHLDRPGARLAVLLLVLNPFHVWYSQEGRGYAFLMLAAVLAMLAYARLLERPTAGRAAALTAAAAACVLSNLSGLFLAFAMGVTLLLVEGSPRGRARVYGVAALLAAVLLTSPWLLQAAGIWAVDRVVPGAATGAALRGESTFTLAALPYTLFTFGYGYSLGPSLRDWHAADAMAVARGALPVLALGGLPLALAVLAGAVGRDRGRVRLLLWCAIPVLILVVLAARNVKPWNPRYVSVVLPAVLLLTALGLRGLRPWAGRATGLLLAGLTLWSLAAYFGADRYDKADVRGAVAVVEAANAAGQAVLVPVVTPVYTYYARDDAPVIDTYGRAPLASTSDAEAFADEVLAGCDGCWLVWARAWYFDPQEHLLRTLARRGHLRAVDERPGVEIYHWQRAARERSSR